MAGGGSSRTDEGKKKARIEIIPLIDVIFFLLATFVLFTLSLNQIKSLPMPLPAAETSGAKPNPDDVTIQISAGDTLYWNKVVMPLSELEANLESYKSRVAEPRILVTGDTDAKHGTTIKVLDALRKSDIKFSAETKIRPTGG